MSEHESSSAHHTIALLGDGLTAAGDWQAWLPQEHVAVVADPRHTSADLMALLPTIVTLSPDDVLLNIGSRDFELRHSVEYVVRNVELFLATLRRELPGTRTLVQSIMPREREMAAHIVDANRHLRQFSSTVRAQYLDLWPALALEDGELDPQYSEDRSSLNAVGYEAWLGELHPAIHRLRDAPPMSSPIGIIRP